MGLLKKGGLLSKIVGTQKSRQISLQKNGKLIAGAAIAGAAALTGGAALAAAPVLSKLVNKIGAAKLNTSKTGEPLSIADAAKGLFSKAKDRISEAAQKELGNIKKDVAGAINPKTGEPVEPIPTKKAGFGWIGGVVLLFMGIGAAISMSGKKGQKRPNRRYY